MIFICEPPVEHLYCTCPPQPGSLPEKGKGGGRCHCWVPLVKMLGDPAPAAALLQLPLVLLRLFLQLVIRPLAAEAGGMRRLSCPQLSM